MKMKTLIAGLLGLCAASAPPLFAAEQPPSPPAVDPAKREEFCKNNPQTCETAQEQHEKKKAWCAENPEKCQALRTERKERLRKLKQKCEASPEECEQKKAEVRQRMQERRERREERRDEAPAPAP